MTIEETFNDLRKQRSDLAKPVVPNSFQGITKNRIKEVLKYLDLDNNLDLVDVVYALLDDQTPSFFTEAKNQGKTFSDGATTAQLGSHVAILQRERTKKLDREGRDLWIKPLQNAGGIEAVTWNKVNGFIMGHIPAKSPNSCYRLEHDLVKIFQAPANAWSKMMKNWIAINAERKRLNFQANANDQTRKILRSVPSSHASLIKTSIDIYAEKFLPGYKVLYVDDSDGDRITEKERTKLENAGIQLTLEDAMPDVLLFNKDSNKLWVIEAVTSDGEVDIHKVQQLEKLSLRSGKAGIGFTTTYQTWKRAALRQGKFKNLAIGNYIWIEEDPSRQYFIQGAVVN